MPPTVRDRRAAQVNDDAASLAHIQLRLQRLRQERAAADALLAEAKRAAEDLGRETRELEDIEQKLGSKLASSRAALVQECVSTLPDDVLRSVFEEVVGNGNPHAPFALAAVCGRWRRVALDFSSLWSTIHIEPVGIGSDAHQVLATEYDRATILLSRSRSAPLDITGPLSLYSGDEVLRRMRRLLHLLGAHVSRWKRARLTVTKALGPSCLDFLKGPTPVLARLSIQGGFMAKDDFGPSKSGYFPFAPRLQYLSISYAGIGCSPGHSFPAMKKLCFFPGACTDDHVLDFIRLSSQSLQSLVLCKSLAHGAPTAIHLPRLSHLSISRASAAIIASATQTPSILTPALAHLNLSDLPGANPGLGADNFLQFLDAVSGTVRKLTVLKTLSADSVAVLARLCNVEQVDMQSSTFSEDALELLYAHDPVVWPRLTCLLNLSFTPDKGASSEAILRFVASRNTSEENDDSADARPCKLREVTFERSAPQWLVAEVQRRLLKF